MALLGGRGDTAAMKRRFAFALLFVAATGVGRRARAQERHDALPEPEVTFEGHLVRITGGGSSRVVDLGCAGRSALRTGTKLLVVCGALGVVEVDLSDPSSPRRGGTMHVDGDATGLFLRDGLVWVEVAHIDARPVRLETLSPFAVPTPPTPERAVPAPKEALTHTPPSAPSPAPEELPSDVPKEGPSVLPRRGKAISGTCRSQPAPLSPSALSAGGCSARARWPIASNRRSSCVRR
jgi:hypothetical protein